MSWNVLHEYLNCFLAFDSSTWIIKSLCNCDVINRTTFCCSHVEQLIYVMCINIVLSCYFVCMCVCLCSLMLITERIQLSGSAEMSGKHCEVSAINMGEETTRKGSYECCACSIHILSRHKTWGSSESSGCVI